MSLDDFERRQAEHVHDGQCSACGALPGHQRPRAMPVRLAADGVSPPTMGPTDVYGVVRSTPGRCSHHGGNRPCCPTGAMVHDVACAPDCPTCGHYPSTNWQTMVVTRPAYEVRLTGIDEPAKPRIEVAADPGLVTRTSDGQTFHLVVIESPVRIGLDPGIGDEPEVSNMVIMRASMDVQFVLRCDGCEDIVRPHLMVEHRCR